VRLADAAAAVRAAVPEATIEIGPGLPDGAAPRAALSVERLASETGFRARWSLEDGVREFVDWKRTGAYGAPVE
jgi:nucleoside-diphosphate-sugar epimerase